MKKQKQKKTVRIDIDSREPKNEFDIPEVKHSWKLRLTLSLGIILFIVVLGVVLYYFQHRDEDAPSALSDLISRSSETLDSNNDGEVSDQDISNDVAGLIDELDTAPDVNKDFEPIGATTTFDAEEEKIYVAIQTKNFVQERQITAEWVYVDTDTFIDEVDYTAEKGINNIAFHLERPASGFWPEGDYEIRIFIDGKLAQIARFDVQREEASEDTTP